MLKNTSEGYMQTEIGVIPCEWEIIELWEMIEYVKGYAFKSSDYRANGIRIIRVSDTSYNKIKDNNKIYIDKRLENRYKKWMLFENDIILSTVGSKPPMYDSMVGNAVKVDLYNSGALLNQNAVKIFSKDVYIQIILYNNFKRKRYLYYIEKIFRGNANQASITLESLFKFKITIPKNPKEQQAIARVLADTESLINSLEKLINKKKLIKQGTMSCLLSGDKRLDGFDDEWSYKKLKEFGEFCSSKRVFLEEYVVSGIPFYRGKEIKELNQGLCVKDMIYITKEKYNTIKNKYGVPKIGDILISAVGSLGNIFLVSDNNPFYFKDGNLIWLKDISISSIFLRYMLEFKNDKLLETAIGSSQKALTIVSLKDVEIRIPKDPKEQQAIATILSDMDKEIEQLEKKLEKYKLIKEGMMDNLLTGRIRLI